MSLSIRASPLAMEPYTKARWILAARGCKASASTSTRPEFLSLDGVMEAPEKWSFPYMDEEMMKHGSRCAHPPACYEGIAAPRRRTLARKILGR